MIYRPTGISYIENFGGEFDSYQTVKEQLIERVRRELTPMLHDEGAGL